jgi:hypothetical protein
MSSPGHLGVAGACRCPRALTSVEYSPRHLVPETQRGGRTLRSAPAGYRQFRQLGGVRVRHLRPQERVPLRRHLLDNQTRHLKRGKGRSVRLTKA